MHEAEKFGKFFHSLAHALQRIAFMSPTDGEIISFYQHKFSILPASALSPSTLSWFGPGDVFL